MGRHRQRVRPVRHRRADPERASCVRLTEPTALKNRLALRVAFATTSPRPIGDVDRPLIDTAAARAGLRPEWVAWRDHGVDWDAFDAVLIRSTWDYHEHVDEFISWSEHVDDVSRLYNSAAIVRWNAHKRYLLDLERRGVPIVPTVVVGRGEAKSLAMITHTHGWNEVVVKPAVSAGAKGTGRYRSDEPAGESALSALLETDDVLVQPYVPEIEGLGETSMVAIDGTVTHAVRKVPGDGDFRVQAHHGGRERGIVPTPPELELAASTMEVVSQMASVSYARIDCVTVDGRPILMELEVIEPALYLPLAPSSVADALVMGVVKRAIARR